MDSIKLEHIVKIAGVGAVLGALWYFTSEGSTKKFTREEFANVMKTLSKEFHLVLVEHALTVVRVQANLKQKGLSKEIGTEQITEILSPQVRQRLDTVQQEVLTSFEMSESDMIWGQEEFLRCPEIDVYVEGFKTMYEDALKGVLPILPNCPIPDALTHDKVLEVVRLQQARKIAAYSAILSAENNKPEEVPRMLQAAGEKTDAETLAGFVEQGLFECKSVFHNALATYLRDAKFFERKQESDRSFAAELAEFAQKRIPGNFSGARLHPALKMVRDVPKAVSKPVVIFVCDEKRASQLYDFSASISNLPTEVLYRFTTVQHAQHPKLSGAQHGQCVLFDSDGDHYATVGCENVEVTLKELMEKEAA